MAYKGLEKFGVSRSVGSLRFHSPQKQFGRQFADTGMKGISGCFVVESGKVNMWLIDRYYGEDICNMGTLAKDQFNLDSDMIAHVLIIHIQKNIQHKVQVCITLTALIYSNTITKRKAFHGCKSTFELIYSNQEKLLSTLPRYMAALQYYNLEIIIIWEHDYVLEIQKKSFQIYVLDI